MAYIRNWQGKFFKPGQAERISQLHLKLKAIDPEIISDHNYTAQRKLPVAACEEVYTDNDQRWKCGRRVVDLGFLAQSLLCTDCGSHLQLMNTSSEEQYGLASVLNIRCACGTTNRVETGRKADGRSFDINKKTATACVEAGIGERQMSTFLATLNIPPTSTKTYQKYEKIMGATIISAAKTSCDNALQEEINSNGDKLTAAFDGGWQKRGSGRQYNSLSGHGAMIGSHTGAVIGFDVLSKSCHYCEYCDKHEIVPKSHNCSKNYSGSSKAMESKIATNIVSHVSSKGATISNIVMDNDSCTMSKLTKMNPDIEKMCDENHTRKNILSSLYELSNTHKQLKNAKTREYVLKLIMTAIKENQSNADKLRSTLLSIPPHIFGKHDTCGSWCGHKADASKKYSRLPYGKPLSDLKLKESLNSLVSKLSSRATSLANLGSTQGVESFHNIVASKAPKARHYGGSSSLEARVSAAVLQKNEGHTAIAEVHKTALLSPGHFVTKLGELRDSQHKRRRESASSVESKRRRKENKATRAKRDNTQAIIEGDSYKSGMGLSSETDDYEIPEAPQRNLPYSKVFFDLETSDLHRTSDILQIAALSDQTCFSVYVKPTRGYISEKSTMIHNISMTEKQLYHKNEKVDSLDIAVALSQFIAYLESGSNVILYGHNIASFDCAVLVFWLSKFNLLDRFKKVAYLCVDTLPLSRKCHPGLESYAQGRLVALLQDKSYDEHNAVSDVKSLKSLYEEKLQTSDKPHVNEDLFVVDCSNLKQGFEPLVKSKCMSKQMALKIAKSGLGVYDIEKAFQRDPELGVSLILGQIVNESVRVTKDARVIRKINNFLSREQ